MKLLLFLAVVLVALTGCGDSALIAGKYTGQSPAAASPERQITLELSDEHTARMVIDYSNGEPPINLEGSWTELRADRARVRFVDSKSGEILDDLTFELRGNRLVAIAYAEKLWGTAGLTLTKVGAL